MRLLLLLAVTVALAYGLWTLLGEDAPAPTTSHVPEPAPDLDAPESPGPRPVPSTVTLVLVVKSAGGPIPHGALGGYRSSGKDRLRPVGPDGRVRFTDAPTGLVTLVARAPGWEDVEQRRYLTGGIPTEAILTLLRPAEK